MELILLLILAILILITIYYCLLWNYNYWQKQGIPCAKRTIPILGNIASVIFLQQNFNTLLEKLYKQSTNCSMFGFYQMNTPTLLLRDPELIKDVLLTNFGNFPNNHLQVTSIKKDYLLSINPFFSKANNYWRQSRAPLSNAFSGKKLKGMLASILNVSSTMKDYLQQKLQNDKVELELKYLFNLYTGEVSAASIGIEANFFKDVPDEWNFKKMVLKLFHSPFFAGGILQVIFLHMSRLGAILNIAMTPKGVEAYLRKFVREIFDQRKHKEKNYSDFIQVISDYVIMANPTPFDRESLISSHVLSFVAETYETVAIVMSFAAFQIAMHPEIQQKVRKEIKSILEKYDGKFEYEGLKEMTYLDQVLNESMRVNHVVGSFIKVCCKETKLVGSDGLSCIIKPGQLAVISAYGLQMDPNYWPEPEKFDPDRFSEEEKSARHKFTFLPFGEGPRTCVGMRMSFMLIKIAIATILNDFSLEVSPKTPLPLVRNESRYLSDYRKGLWVILKPLEA